MHHKLSSVDSYLACSRLKFTIDNVREVDIINEWTFNVQTQRVRNADQSETKDSFRSKDNNAPLPKLSQIQTTILTQKIWFYNKKSDSSISITLVRQATRRGETR